MALSRLPQVSLSQQCLVKLRRYLVIGVAVLDVLLRELG